MNSFIIPTELELLGGLQFFKFIATSEVASIQTPANGLVNVQITLNAGGAWGNGYASRGSLAYECDAKSDKGRPLYDHQLKGFYPGLSPEMSTLFTQMLTKKFVVIAPDNNGINHLFGGKLDGLSFKFSEKTGKTPSDRPGYEFEFFGKTRMPRYKYLATVLAPPGPGTGTGGTDY